MQKKKKKENTNSFTNIIFSLESGFKPSAFASSAQELWGELSAGLGQGAPVLGLTQNPAGVVVKQLTLQSCCFLLGEGAEGPCWPGQLLGTPGTPVWPL